MSLADFNKALDDSFEGNEPDRNLMKNSRDYFEGYCYGESINDEEEEIEEEVK